MGMKTQKELLDEPAAAPPAGDPPLIRELKFRKELERLINAHSRENGSDTPDFILAEYLLSCLEAFDRATRHREACRRPDPAA